jgi:hypothetical protein
MFRFWLHSECGYSFVGDNSFYKLTIPELRVLRSGYSVMMQQKKDKQKGVKPSDRARLKDFDDRLKRGEI